MRKRLTAVSILFTFIVCSSNVSALGLQDIAGAFSNGIDVNNVTYGNDDDDYGSYNNNYNNNNNGHHGGGGNDDDHYGGGGDDDDHYSNDDDDSSEIPLDGGLSFLAIAGAGLGIKKLRDNRAKKKERDNEE